MNVELQPILQLSIPEKLQIVEDLWDDIASSPDRVPVLEWQKEELTRRKASHTRNPASAVSWEEAKKRIRRQRG